MALQKAEERVVVVEGDRRPPGKSKNLKSGLYQVACAVTIYDVSRNFQVAANSQIRNSGRFLQKMYLSNLESLTIPR